MLKEIKDYIVKCFNPIGHDIPKYIEYKGVKFNPKHYELQQTKVHSGVVHVISKEYILPLESEDVTYQLVFKTNNKPVNTSCIDIYKDAIAEKVRRAMRFK